MDGQRTAIETVVADYVEGMIFADAARLRRAFHPDAHVVGHWAGALEWLTVDAFVTACLAAGSAPAGTKPFWRIETLEVAGDVATLRLADDYMGLRFTDLLTLIEDDGRWQIVSKAYYVNP